MSGYNLIDLEFFPKFLSLFLTRLRNLDHNERMDLIDKGDSSSPDPVHTRKLTFDIHNKEGNDKGTWEEKGRRKGETGKLSQVFYHVMLEV